MCDGKLKTVSISLLVSCELGGKHKWQSTLKANNTAKSDVCLWARTQQEESFYGFYQETIQFQMFWLVFSTAS